LSLVKLWPLIRTRLVDLMLHGLIVLMMLLFLLVMPTLQLITRIYVRIGELGRDGRVQVRWLINALFVLGKRLACGVVLAVKIGQGGVRVGVLILLVARVTLLAAARRVDGALALAAEDAILGLYEALLEALEAFRVLLGQSLRRGGGDDDFELLLLLLLHLTEFFEFLQVGLASLRRRCHHHIRATRVLSSTTVLPRRRLVMTTVVTRGHVLAAASTARLICNTNGSVQFARCCRAEVIERLAQVFGHSTHRAQVHGRGRIQVVAGLDTAPAGFGVSRHRAVVIHGRVRVVFVRSVRMMMMMMIMMNLGRVQIGPRVFDYARFGVVARVGNTLGHARIGERFLKVNRRNASHRCLILLVEELSATAVLNVDEILIDLWRLLLLLLLLLIGGSVGGDCRRGAIARGGPVASTQTYERAGALVAAQRCVELVAGGDCRREHVAAQGLGHFTQSSSSSSSVLVVVIQIAVVIVVVLDLVIGVLELVTVV
jgi:hypothetical protein